MERLTKRIDGGLVFPNELIGVMMTPSNDTMCQILTRLAAYEDTGLEPEDLKKAFNETAILKLAAQALSTTPDHLRDLLQAEQDERLVVLPCKVGDTVYQIDAERVYESEVKWIIFDCDDIAFDERAIGVSIFLTREEAEAALAQEGGKDHA